MRVPQREREKERESLTEMINKWTKDVEGKRSSVQEERSIEKDHSCRIRGEWEATTVDGDILTRAESRVSLVQQRDSHPFMNGSAELDGQGLVTPHNPQPILRLDTTKSRKRDGSSCGRTEPPSQTTTPPVNTDPEEFAWFSNNCSATSPRLRPRSPREEGELSDSEAQAVLVDVLL